MEASPGPPPAAAGSHGSQAIDRAFAVLNCFMGPDPQLGVTVIARRLDLNISTAHRIVRALVHAGYLDQNPKSGEYHLGRSAVLLGQHAQRAVGLEVALPILERLAETTGESVNLGILSREGDTGIIALRVETRHHLRFEQPVGTRIGLSNSAMGKAMLAFHPDGVQALRQLGRLPALTEHSITSQAELRGHLEEIRRHGFSLCEQESQMGVRCIGAPVLDPDGYAHAAIAVQIPAVRMAREKLPELAPLVMDAAKRVAARMPADRSL